MMIAWHSTMKKTCKTCKFGIEDIAKGNAIIFVGTCLYLKEPKSKAYLHFSNMFDPCVGWKEKEKE